MWFFLFYPIVIITYNIRNVNIYFVIIFYNIFAKLKKVKALHLDSFTITVFSQYFGPRGRGYNGGDGGSRTRVRIINNLTFYRFIVFNKKWN